MNSMQTSGFVVTGTASSDAQFIILSPQDAEKYMKMAQGEPSFLKLIRETFTITHTFTKGLTSDELDILIARASQPVKQKLLQQVRLLGDKQDGQTILLASTDIEHRMRNSWVVRGEFKNGKFNILTVFATQIKELSAARVAACGVGALSLSTLGFIINPLLGAGILTSVTAATVALAAKEYKDYCECPADVVYGPIFEHLRDQNILDVSQISD